MKTTLIRSGMGMLFAVLLTTVTACALPKPDHPVIFIHGINGEANPFTTANHCPPLPR